MGSLRQDDRLWCPNEVESLGILPREAHPGQDLLRGASFAITSEPVQFWAGVYSKACTAPWFGLFLVTSHLLDECKTHFYVFFDFAPAGSFGDSVWSWPVFTRWFPSMSSRQTLHHWALGYFICPMSRHGLLVAGSSLTWTDPLLSFYCQCAFAFGCSSSHWSTAHFGSSFSFSAGPLFIPYCYAPNTHIGGSGVGASISKQGNCQLVSAIDARTTLTSSESSFHQFSEFTKQAAAWVSRDLGAWIISFYLSLALLSLFALLKMLLYKLPGNRSTLSLPAKALFAAVPTALCLGWRVGDPYSCPASVHKDARSTRKTVRSRGTCRPGITHCGLSSLIYCCGLLSTPVCVWSAPQGLIEAVVLAEAIVETLPEQLSQDCDSSKGAAPSADVDLLRLPQTTKDPASLPKHCVVFQAGFSAKYQLAYVSLPCNEGEFTGAATELCRSSTRGHHLVATRPQVKAGLASFVAVPTWTQDTEQSVYVLDFSYWQGPVFAILDWRHVTVTSLAAAASLYAPGPWQVNHPGLKEPLGIGQHVRAAPGDVFTFLPAGASPPGRILLRDMLSNSAAWDPCPDEVPRECTRHEWLALRSHVTRIPKYAGTCLEELKEVAAEAFHSEADELDFEFPHNDSPLQDLVYRGSAIRGVLAAEPRSDSGNRNGVFVFIDSRLIGRQPSFRFCAAGWIRPCHLLDFLADVKVPVGYRLAYEGVPTHAEQVLVSDRCTVTLHFETCLTASGQPPEPGRTLSGVGDFISGGPAVAANPAPHRVDRNSPPSPDPEEALRAEQRDEDAALPAEGIVAHFLVFSPRYQHESYQLELQVPCTLELALEALANIRDSGCSVHFEELFPAFPQPDVAFASIVAAPSWASTQCCVLIDSRDYDGRLFSIEIKGRLNRSSLLLHIQVPDSADIRLYCGRVILENDLWIDFLPGETITVKTRDGPLAPPVSLADMLGDRFDWATQISTYHGPHFPAFQVLADGGSKVILVDVNTIRSFSDFKQLTATVFQHTSGCAHVGSSVPRVCDLSVLGQSCKAVLVATEAVRRIQIPPGRLKLLRTIAFLDRRLLLKDFSWVVAEQGLIDLDRLIEVEGEDRPYGYCLQVKGACTELRRGRTFLRIPHGTLLILSYVEENPSSSCLSIHAPDSDSEQDGSTDTEGESTASHRSDDTPACAKPATDRGPSRSRSPRRDSSPCEPGTRHELLKVCLSHHLPRHRESCLLYGANTGVVSCGWPGPHGISFSLPFGRCKQVCDRFGGICTLKLLPEPHATTPVLRNNLAFLRYAAPRLGGAWRYMPPIEAPHIVPDSDSESSAEDSSDEPTTLHFVVLAPGFVHEHIVALIRLPATINEVIQRIQTLRSPARVRKFTSLVPASPQPCPGNGVLIALPAWYSTSSPHRPFLCFDTTLVDGRLFTKACPAYVSRRHLLHLADLSGRDDIEVHAGDDNIPLSNEGQLHVEPGHTFVFVPAGTVVPTMHSLAIDLFSRQEWNPALVVTSLRSDGVCALVHEGEAILYTTAYSQPTVFREQIAACVGIGRQHLRLYPSSPRIPDASLEGRPCRTVIAVCGDREIFDTSSFCILVDARALLLGWHAIATIAGRVSCLRVLLILPAEAPPGWRVCLEDIPEGTDHIEVQPGQVFVAAVVPNVHTALTAAEPVTDALSQDTTSADTTQVNAPDPGSTPLTTGNRSPDSTPERPGGDPPGAPEDDERGHTQHTAHVAYVSCSFLVLGQNYIAEHVVVRLPVGVDTAVAVASVAAARAPQDVAKLPRIQAVHPQPSSSHALCVAGPDWDVYGPIIAIDSRGVNGRLFAIHLAGQVDRVGLFNIAQLDPHADIDVFIGNQPWPLINDHFVNLLHGDLVLFVYAQARHHAVGSLQDMLASAYGWEVDFDPAQHIFGGFHAHTWLMSDYSAEFFLLRPDRRSQLRQDIAAQLQVSSRELVLQPARLRDPDFAYKGVAASSVLAAFRSTGFLPSPRLRPVVCFIDARPILYTLTWQVCPDGVIDSGVIANRFLGHCPAGYSIAVLRQDSLPLRIGEFIPVDDGEVFTILFVPFRTLPNSEPHSPDSPDDDDADEDTADDAGDDGPAIAITSALSSSGPPPGAADTGGTSHALGGSTHCICRFVVKWSLFLFHGAVLAGRSGITSVHFGVDVGVEGFSAVCGLLSNIIIGIGACQGLASILGARSVKACRQRPSLRGAPFKVIYSDSFRTRGLGDMCALDSTDSACRYRSQGDTPVSETSVFGNQGPTDVHIAVQWDGNPFADQANGSPSSNAFPASDRPRPPRRHTFGSIWLPLCVCLTSVQAAGAVCPAVSGINEGLCRGHEVPSNVNNSTRRPVATPARNSNSRLQPATISVQDEIFFLGPTITLLEQSVAQPDSEAFFLASTLLETVFEHYDRVTQSTWGSISDKQLLCLSNHLPSQVVHEVSCVSLDTPLPVDEVAAFLSCVWTLPHNVPDGVKLHAATQQAFQSFVPYDVGYNAGISSIAVFTDGSFGNGLSSWAFVAIAESPPGSFLLAWARGKVCLQGQDGFIGASEHSALSAERSAVFWAIAWLLGVDPAIPYTLHCDCVVAAFQANGKFGASTQSAFANACRSLVQALEARGSFSATSILHVRGHQGHPYNEFADTLAGESHLEDTPFPAQYSSLRRWASDGILSWLWLTVAAWHHPDNWPLAKGHQFVDAHGNCTLTPDGLSPQDFFGSQLNSESKQERDPTRFQIDGLFLTVNVQSLCEDEGSQLPNRVPYIREQLEWIGCAVAGFQETRAKATSTIVSHSHVRFLSSCDSHGCLGVELWFSKTVPLGWVGSTPLRFLPEDFRVLHWTPRTLFVRYVKGSLRILFVVCHAPTATSPEREGWWKSFADLLLHAANGDKVVILGDLNARLCEPLPGRVGDLVWECEHQPPAPFFRIIRELDLWLPATFRECHHGLSHTWSAPGGTSTSRIDFILIPTGWWVPPKGSSVLYQVDFGQSGLDHFAVQLHASASFTAWLPFQARRLRFDSAKAAQPESVPIVQAIFDAAPSVSWETDSHRHYHRVSSYLLEAFAAQFPARKGARRRTFFSETTWSLRQQRVWLRKQAHIASANAAFTDLRCAFQAWSWGVCLGSALRRQFGKALYNVSRLRTVVTELRHIRPAFRQSLRRDKGQYLSEVAAQAAVTQTKDVVRRLRPLLGPPRRKQRGAAPLPAVRLEDGTFATSPEEADARWLRHFSAAEHGGPIDPEELIDRCFRRQRAFDLDAFDVDGHDLPSQVDLETAFRFAQPGRASGNDGMPPDILHHFPGPVAKLFYPILLKVAFRLQEPLQFKGGSVSHIYKNKGDLAECKNHRGILISNNIGKGFHSAFRRKCGRWYDAAATPLQTGGRRGFPVTLASQTVRSYQVGHLQRGRSAAVIFLDLKEAFHKVARPLVHGGDLSDLHLAKVIQAFGLSPDHMHLLRTYVQESSLLVPAGASPWAANMVREFQEDSWLTVGSGLAVVESGTRPGDSLADITFSFLFASVLRRIRDAMLHSGYEVRLPWGDSWFRTLCPEEQPDEHLAPIDVSWMDDLALLLSASTPEALIEAARGSASALVDECLKALLHPNLDPGKTEAILSLVGKGSRKLRTDLFRDSEPSLQLSSTLWPTSRLRLVPKYSHLGGMLHFSGALAPEVQARSALAWKAFRKHRRLIFAAPTVTHREKSLLFNSLVLSSLLYGAGAWSISDGAVPEKLQGVLLAMARQMLRPTYSFEEACHLGARKILATARIPSACVLLHVERLRHLAVITRVAPKEFWAVLHYEATWCRLAHSSIEWLRTMLEASGKAQPRLDDWTFVLSTLLDAPHTWKRWVNTARQTALLQELWEAEVQHYHGLLFRYLLTKGAVIQDLDVSNRVSPEICAICQQRFPDLRCWSHHAFKRHGRIREARLVAWGTQCQVCLRHFATTFRLSNHLEHSRFCLAALVQQSRFAEVAPGRGSRRFRDGRDSLLPAVTASGPQQQWSAEGHVPESERADSVILDGLSEIFCQPDAIPDIESLLHSRPSVKSFFVLACKNLDCMLLQLNGNVYSTRSSVLKKTSLYSGLPGIVVLLIGCARLILLLGLCPMLLTLSRLPPLFGMALCSCRGCPSIGSFSRSVLRFLT